MFGVKAILKRCPLLYKKAREGRSIPLLLFCMKFLRVQQLFCSGKLDGATENFHGLFELFKRRE